MNLEPLRLMTLMLAAVVYGALWSVPASGQQQQQRVPQFKDYPAGEIYRGRSAEPILTADNRAYRTRLREAARGRPNFAGRYIVTRWGCGTSCQVGAVIDARTGRVYWFPDTICCWGYDTDEDFDPVVFRLDSRLIIFSGARGEKEGDVGTHFYKFENGRFIHLRSLLKENQE